MLRLIAISVIIVLIVGFCGFSLGKLSGVNTALFVCGSTFEIVFLVCLAALARSKRAQIFLVCVFSLNCAFVWLVSWRFFTFFATLPGRFTIRYLRDEPADAWNLVKNIVSFEWLALLVITTTGLYWLLSWGLSKASSLRLKTIGAGVLFCLPILWNGYKNHPGKGSPGIDLAFSAVSFVLQNNTNWTKNLMRLQPRPLDPRRLKPVNRDLPFNVLLIVHESLRHQNMSIYGYKKTTTPHLSKWIQQLSESSHNAYIFNQAFSNSTFTHSSYPSLLSGVHPINGWEEIHKHPLIHEYAKLFQNATNAIISTHSYQTGNYDAYLRSKFLDRLVYRETEGWPAFNNLGADDRFLVKATSDYMNSKLSSDNFFLVVHHNGTHFPYRSPENAGSESDLQSYDQTILYVDSIMDQYLNILNLKDVLRHTLIIITSDHGESFGENGTNGHFGPIHPSNSQIPFIWIIPRYADVPGMKSYLDRPVSNIDIAPTLLNMLGIGSPGLKGKNLNSSNGNSNESVLIFNGGSGQELLHYGIVDRKGILQSFQVDHFSQKSSQSDLSIFRNDQPR